MRASITTRSNCDRRREGIIAIESSKWKVTGHAPTVVRSTASGGPGESAAFAYIKSVASECTRSLKRRSRLTVPDTSAPAAVLAAVAVLAAGAADGVPASEFASAILASIMRASCESGGNTARSFFHQPRASA